MRVTLNWFQYRYYLITGKTPKKFGVLEKEGIWYDSYHNKETGESWAFEKRSGTFLWRE